MVFVEDQDDNVSDGNVSKGITVIGDDSTTKDDSIDSIDKGFSVGEKDQADSDGPLSD